MKVTSQAALIGKWHLQCNLWQLHSRLPSFLSSKLHYNFVAILAHHCHMLKYRWHAQPKHQSALHIWFGNRRISPWCRKEANLIIWVFTILQRWSLIPWHIWSWMRSTSTTLVLSKQPPATTSQKNGASNLEAAKDCKCHLHIKAAWDVTF